jgi:glycosyltransferase involved in cell wall biosynthesis
LAFSDVTHFGPKLANIPENTDVNMAATKDVFICHASEDKQKIAGPLKSAFDRDKISSWYDEAEIEWGESIVEKINEGLRSARFVIVILSPAFMRQHWPKRELFAGLSEEASAGRNTVLPLLAGSAEERDAIFSQLYLLNDKMYLIWDGNPAGPVEALQSLLGRNYKTVRRVCHISSEYPPKVFGGLGVHVEQLTKALSRSVSVDVVLPSAGASEYETLYEDVQPFALSTVTASYEDPVSWLRFADFAADRIIRRAKDHRPDIIHCHDWVTVLAGIKCRWVLDVPLVFHLHLPNRSPLCASVENLGLICADRVTVNSEAMYEALKDRSLPLRREPDVIKNGVDQDMFHADESWPSDGDYVLCVGRLVEQKGVEYLIRAFLYVREKFPTLRLKVVGSGELADALENLATNLLISDQVDFLGWKSAEALVKLYQRAGVVVVPSIYEPFGMTALEGMACQRPVVASRTGGLSDIIRHGVTGFLAEPKDELDLAQWLLTALADSNRRAEMGRLGREHLRVEGYTWADVSDQFKQLYEEVSRKPIDKTIPSRTDEFIEQIVEVATDLSPDFSPESSKVLEHVFSWRMKSREGYGIPS